jgi:two-component system phosphate regulon sensor histidine kinase PhoR
MAESLQEPSVKADEAVSSEFVGSIVSESDRLLDDLQDILQPVEAGYIPDVEEFDVCALVSSVVNAERHTGRAENHKLTLDGADAPIFLLADRRKIRRVVENLISNAVKYSPGNGKTVSTEIRVVGKRVAIHVVDQGLGLTPEQLKDLLGKGGRVEDHARLGIEGTGIGLGSVRHILQAHGGELRAQSSPGLGSRFTAIIPIRYQSKGH